jgi:hypothetical protein
MSQIMNPTRFLKGLCPCSVLAGSALHGQAYGRLAHSGGVYETPHVTITASEIAGLTAVAITEDYLSGLYLGAEYDRISVVVPEPTSSLVFLIGAAGFVLLNRFRST